MSFFGILTIMVQAFGIEPNWFYVCTCIPFFSSFCLREFQSYPVERKANEKNKSTYNSVKFLNVSNCGGCHYPQRSRVHLIPQKMDPQFAWRSFFWCLGVHCHCSSVHANYPKQPSFIQRNCGCLESTWRLAVPPTSISEDGFPALFAEIGVHFGNVVSRIWFSFLLWWLQYSADGIMCLFLFPILFVFFPCCKGIWLL